MAVDYDLDRKLRTIQVYNFVAALCLGIPAGTNGPSIIVPMAIIPAAFSAVLGVLGVSGALKKPCVSIPFDSIMTAIYLGLLIPTWILLARTKPYYAGGVMLATYATVPIILNFLIHLHSIIRYIPLAGLKTQTVCPNCQHEHEVHKKFFHPSTTIFSRSVLPSTIYTPDDDEEDRLTRDFDDESTIQRASSDIDGSTLWQGEGRQLINQPPLEVKRNPDHQV